MKAHVTCLMTAGVLILCSLWAFLSIEKTAYTALIPAAFGLGLMICVPGLKSGRIWAFLVAAVLSLFILVALYVPLTSALEEQMSLSLVRILAMMAACLFSLAYLSRALIVHIVKNDRTGA